MNKSYLVHWILGALCVVVAFWGNYLWIPAQYVSAAGALIPGIIAHALAFVPDLPVPPAPTEIPLVAKQPAV